MMRILRFTTVLILSISFFVSCKNEDHKDDGQNQGPTYFSIKDFTKDQWNTFHGQPIAIQQTTTLNGESDTQVISALTMKWSAIFKTFFETDISDPKFLNQYDFSDFEEATTQTRTFSYQARDNSLYTQKLQIKVDAYSNKVRNIYIETQAQTFWNNQTKKLLYSPMRVLQIQEHNDPLIGKQKDLVIEYKFL